MELAELAMDFAVSHLEPGVRSWSSSSGEGFEDYVKALRARFKQVMTRKPEASRDRSNEVYLLNQNVKRPRGRLAAAAMDSPGNRVTIAFSLTKSPKMRNVIE